MPELRSDFVRHCMLSGYSVFEYGRADSTNNIALSVLRSAQNKSEFEDVVIVAREQTCGRGRNNRSWLSPQGGLYFSVIKNCADVAMQFVAAAAALTAVQSLKIPALYKWPNDLMTAEGKKLGGILAELHAVGQWRATILGIGINIAPNDLQPQGGVAPAFAGTYCNIAPQALMLPVLEHLSHYAEVYRYSGFEPIRQLLQDNLYGATATQIVSVKLPNGQMIEGVAPTIAQDGSLQLLDCNGRALNILVGDIISESQ